MGEGCSWKEKGGAFTLRRMKRLRREKKKLAGFTSAAPLTRERKTKWTKKERLPTDMLVRRIEIVPHFSTWGIAAPHFRPGIRELAGGKRQADRRKEGRFAVFDVGKKNYYRSLRW